MQRELLELESIRLDAGLSYRRLAEHIGVSHTVLWKSIRRITEPSDLNMHRIRRYLDAREKPRRRKVS